MKNCNMTLAAKISALPLGKIDKYEYLKGEEILPAVLSQIIQQAKFIYYPLGKAFERLTEKHIDALKSLNFPNKINELKQIESIFPKNQVNDLFIDKLKEIMKLQNNIKLDDLNLYSEKKKML